MNATTNVNMHKEKTKLIYKKKNDSNKCIPSTFLTIVSFGFRTASPPGGSLGAPVTN